MASQGEQAATELVVPDFDFVVITAGDEERLHDVEVSTANRAFVLMVVVDDGSSAVIDDLNDTVVETAKNPRARRMEANAFDTSRSKFEFDNEVGV